MAEDLYVAPGRTPVHWMRHVCLAVLGIAASLVGFAFGVGAPAPLNTIFLWGAVLALPVVTLWWRKSARDEPEDRLYYYTAGGNPVRLVVATVFVAVFWFPLAVIFAVGLMGWGEYP